MFQTSLKPPRTVALSKTTKKRFFPRMKHNNLFTELLASFPALKNALANHNKNIDLIINEGN